METRNPKNDRFEQFWQIYPRHEVKVKARQVFERINPDDDTLKAMLQWIGQAKYSKQWQSPHFIPHPATWLNQRRWEDDVPPLPEIHTDTVGLYTGEDTEKSPEFSAAIAARAKAFNF
jgi:hypothetical protein